MNGCRRIHKYCAFTLIELLVVIGIIALLVAILVPALGGARRGARTTVCQANLRGVMLGMHTYSNDYADAVVPSYTIKGTTGGALHPLEGWGPILHQGAYVHGNRRLDSNPYTCPDTLDRFGLPTAQTGSDPDNPKGYMDWPTVLTLSAAYPRTIPPRGFNEIIRVGYWINAENPIGTPRAFVQGRHFTGSVGFGPDADGKFLEANRLSQFREPSRLIALADGLYAGNQEKVRVGDRDSRIGYRHLINNEPAVNIALADGHCEKLASDDFPRKYVVGMDLEELRNENLGAGPTTYAHPARDLELGD
ncbi:MAG: prepilin-type N-terminal cleavage/methylation domain-containing protein [Phycisphaerae bacterium]